MQTLAQFLEQKSKDVDVFCFQEVLDMEHESAEVAAMKKTHAGSKNDEVLDLYPKLRKILHGFDSIVTEPYSSLGERMAIFYRKGTKLSSYGEFVSVEHMIIELTDNKSFNGECLVQYIEIELNGESCLIASTHGLWQHGKDDTPERLGQSDKIIEFLSKFNHKKVLVGDFNLNPDTKSVKKIEESGMLNLIRKYNIKTTRSKLTPESKGKFADYAFVSKDVNLKEFEVLQDPVSDHLPLYLDFS